MVRLLWRNTENPAVLQSNRNTVLMNANTFNSWRDLNRSAFFFSCLLTNVNWEKCSRVCSQPLSLTTSLSLWHLVWMTHKPRRHQSSALWSWTHHAGLDGVTLVSKTTMCDITVKTCCDVTWYVNQHFVADSKWTFQPLRAMKLIFLLLQHHGIIFQ